MISFRKQAHAVDTHTHATRDTSRSTAHHTPYTITRQKSDKRQETHHTTQQTIHTIHHLPHTTHHTLYAYAVHQPHAPYTSQQPKLPTDIEACELLLGGASSEQVAHVDRSIGILPDQLAWRRGDLRWARAPQPESGTSDAHARHSARARPSAKAHSTGMGAVQCFHARLGGWCVARARETVAPHVGPKDYSILLFCSFAALQFCSFAVALFS
jgi:hypothetical protein